MGILPILLTGKVVYGVNNRLNQKASPEILFSASSVSVSPHFPAVCCHLFSKGKIIVSVFLRAGKIFFATEVMPAGWVCRMSYTALSLRELSKLMFS